MTKSQTTNATRITNIRITPVAFHDPPLLNSVGVHQPFAIRSVIEVDTSDGITGLGESYGDSWPSRASATASATR